MRQCKGFNTYRGLLRPRCNKGKGCDACNTLYNYAQRSGISGPRPEHFVEHVDPEHEALVLLRQIAKDVAWLAREQR